MNDMKTGRAARVLWSVAAGLLLLLWLASMPLDDDRLCSPVPLGLGFAGVLLLGVAAMVVGGRPARPTLTCLFGLAAGCYFLLRCLAGDMLVEIWRELPQVFAAFLFYAAGFLVAQRRGGAVLTTALVVGVLVNIVYFFIMRSPDFPLEAAGRPSMSLSGPNGKGMGRTLFTYGNFSTLFLFATGGVLLLRPVWTGWQGWRSFFPALVGMAGVVFSCLCGGNSIVVLAPLMLIVGWVLWAIIRLCSGQNLGLPAGLTGLAILVGLFVLLGELFMGNELMQKLLSANLHGRPDIWRPMFELLPQLPWHGYGAGASTWRLVPYAHALEVLPNYAHNEYLQAWMDYGIVGVGLVVGVLLTHLAAGYWSLASEEVGRERRALVAACMLLLLALACCAVFEFVWHSVALVGLTAFACGVLAAPVPNRGESWFNRRRWAAGSRPSLRPVRLLGKSGTALCCMGALALAGGSLAFSWRLLPAWKAQWEYNALCHAGASEAQRVVFLEGVIPFYPDPTVADHYVTLTPPAKRKDNRQRMIRVLQQALEGNPHQLFTVAMLSDVLGSIGRCDEAEALLREKYPQGGLPMSGLDNWPSHYGMNLLRWGQQRLHEGDLATALSMMEHALNIWSHVGTFDHYRQPPSRRQSINRYLTARRIDVDMMQAIGVEKDNSWMQPQYPGGPSALYEAWGRGPGERKGDNPYTHYSPLKG